MEIKSKLPHVGTTIFSVMTNLAIEHNAINLSQGFPDFDVNPHLISLVEKYIRQGFNQYAPMQGVLPSVFYRERDDHRVLRFCFAKKDETLKEAADKLCGI